MRHFLKLLASPVNYFIKTILILMKNHKSLFESQALEDDNDLKDIFKLLTELDKAKNNNELHQENSNLSHYSKKRDNQPPISEDSQPLSVSIKNKCNASIKLTKIKIQPVQSIVRESSQISIQEQCGQINHQSNLSQYSFQQAQMEAQQPKQPPTQRQIFIIRKTGEQIQEKNRILSKLQQQLRVLTNQLNEQQKGFEQQKIEQKMALRKILRQSNSKRIKYNEYIEYSNKQRKRVFDEEVIERNSSLLKMIKDEQIKPKSRKRIKNAHNMSLSDEEEQKVTQYMQKQKKHYFTVIASKILKEKQKYENVSFINISKNRRVIIQERKKLLQSHEILKNIQMVGVIQDNESNFEIFLGIDLQRCTEIRINCIKFNPSTSNESRSKIYEQFLSIFSEGKKMTINSKNYIFNQNSSVFIPISHLLLIQDELLLVNQCSHNHFSLATFLSSLDLGQGQQQLHIARYIIRTCIKGMQQISAQLKTENAIILPQNLLFNQKWQLKLNNVLFNQFLFQYFKHLLHESDFVYFPPEQKMEKHSSFLWSLGILTYTICFGGCPFPKYQPYSWKTREEFLMFNEIQVNFKSNSYDRCKQFIVYCLSKKGPINFNEISSEPFMAQLK